MGNSHHSALILITGEDALGQYFMRNLADFLNREPEAAVVNPFNPQILAQHLECAAAELPLTADEPLASEKNAAAALNRLEETGKLLRSADGRELYSRRKSPHRYVNIRGAGNRFQEDTKKRKSWKFMNKNRFGGPWPLPDG